MKFTIIPVTNFQQNCTLVSCEKTGKAAVIDPGGDIERILAEIDKQGVTLEKILITHAHIDHAGAAGQLAREHQLPIEGPHPEDQFWIDGLPEQAKMFGFPAAEQFKPDRWLAQDDTVSIGEETLHVRHCPGHTPGHVIFYHPANQLAIVGDVIFKGSIGRTDFPRGDHQTLIDSINLQILTLPDEVQLISGHGPMTSVGIERATNPYLT
jgi:hydroxyacylglutathione hydrolase